MNRKQFIRSGLGIASLLGSKQLGQVNFTKKSKHNFKLNYAPKFGTFKHHAGEDLMDQLDFFAEMGFKGLTDDGMWRRDVSTQDKIGRRLEKLNLKMGVIAGHRYSWDKPDLVKGKGMHLDSFLKDIKKTIEISKRVGAKWITVMPGTLDLRVEMGYQTSNVIDALKRASEILEPYGIVMVIEPVNRNYPGLFLSTISQAYAICKSVDSPSCKILNDLYHQQITEGNLIHNINEAWDEIGIFQVGDNPGRMEPFTGEINFSNIFKLIYSKGYTGLLGMEHGNSIAGITGEKAVIDAYIRADNF